MFPRLIFENYINRTLATILGRWSTRLYIVLLIFSLVITTSYTAIRPQTLTYTVKKPSLNNYQKLMLHHADRLACPCSVISAPYQNVLDVTVTFHQVRK